MRVIIQLALDIALALQSGGPQTPALQQVLEVASEFGVSLRPVHPGETDPLLAPYFAVDLPDAPTARRFIERLHGNTAVVAAYPEPSISPP
jgi:hypothetical protein